jgi:hypothetical protein
VFSMKIDATTMYLPFANLNEASISSKMRILSEFFEIQFFFRNFKFFCLKFLKIDATAVYSHSWDSLGRLRRPRFQVFIEIFFFLYCIYFQKSMPLLCIHTRGTHSGASGALGPKFLSKIRIFCNYFLNFPKSSP